MPVTFELSQCSASASALIGSGVPGSSCCSAIACIGASPSSLSVVIRRCLSPVKICQKRPQASRAGASVAVDDGMRQM